MNATAVDIVNDELESPLLELYRDWPDNKVLVAEGLDEVRPSDIKEAVENGYFDHIPKDAIEGLEVAIRHPEREWIAIDEVSADAENTLVSVTGQVADVGKRQKRFLSIRFVCNRCGSVTEIIQPTHEYVKPDKCTKCDRKSVTFNRESANTTTERWATLKTLPDADNPAGERIQIRIGEPIDDRSPEDTIAILAGKSVVVHGEIKVDEGSLQKGAPTFKHYIEAGYIEPIKTGVDSRTVSRWQDTVETTVQSATDPVQTFADSIAPTIERTDALSSAMLLSTAWLFGAPRHKHNGKWHRGDIHTAIIGDPGTAKSVLASTLADIAPYCEHRSATGISSEVGLTAAAVRSDLSDKWVLEPGILVRTNGGHAIIEEVDKSSVDLTKINDAIEGEQVQSIDKAGISAQLETRCGVLITANPEDGRFSDYANPLEEVGIDPSLLSRMDGLITISDWVDSDKDRAIAESVLDSWQSMLDGDTDEYKETVEQLRVWVYLGRQIEPTLPDAVKERLAEFYVDVRNVNDSDTIPITARKLESGIRFATAFARCRLADEISVEDAEKAIELSKTIMGQTFMEGEFDADVLTEATPKTQRDRKHRIRELLLEDQLSIDEIAEETGIEPHTIEQDIEKWKQSGHVYMKEQGVYTWVA